MNTRRPLFKDVRVRQALDLALDFEWLNRQLFFNQYRRIDSFFVNTDLQAKGMPSRRRTRAARTVARATRSGRVRRDAAAAGHRSAAARCAPICIKARAVARRKPAGPIATARCATRRASRSCSRFSTTPAAARRWSRSRAAFARNLQKLGITLQLPHGRTTRSIQKRLDAFDFDMTSVRMPDVQVPGTEQIARFGSKSADEQGSDNLIGREVAGRRCDPAGGRVRADARATRRRDARARPRADAWLLCGAALVLGDASRGVSNTLGFPSTLPLYYGAEDWITSTWWFEAAPAKRKLHSLRSQPERRHVELHPQTHAADDPDAARRADADLRRDPVRAGRPGRAVQCTSCATARQGGAPFGLRTHTGVDAQQIAQLKKLYGFDKPPLERYVLMLEQASRASISARAISAIRACGR